MPVPRGWIACGWRARSTPFLCRFRPESGRWNPNVPLCRLGGALTQCFGGADYVLKHRVTIDLLSQREVFVAHPLFGLLAIFDVSSRREPPRYSALFIEQRVVAKQKPAIPPIFAAHALFNLKRHSTCQAAASFAPCSFEIVGMKVSLMSLITSRALHLFKGYVRYSRAAPGSPEVETPPCPGPGHVEEGNQ